MSVLLEIARGNWRLPATVPPRSETEAMWREFEVLLAIVGPTYFTPASEYAEIRAAARRDLPGALTAYREMAKQKFGEQ